MRLKTTKDLRASTRARVVNSGKHDTFILRCRTTKEGNDKDFGPAGATDATPRDAMARTDRDTVNAAAVDGGCVLRT